MGSHGNGEVGKVITTPNCVAPVFNEEDLIGDIVCHAYLNMLIH